MYDHFAPDSQTWYRLLLRLNNDESTEAFKIIFGTMIVFAQMSEHTHKFIAFQPAKLIEKTCSKCA